MANCGNQVVDVQKRVCFLIFDAYFFQYQFIEKRYVDPFDANVCIEFIAELICNLPDNKSLNDTGLKSQINEEQK